MKINKIELFNINSLKGEWNIDFTEIENLFLITGETGSGKTTILDAICVALYGETPRQNKAENIMSKNTGECYSKCEFQIKNKLYKSYWGAKRAYKKADGKLQTPEMFLYELVDGEWQIIAEKQKEVKKKIKELTNFDFSKFTKSMMLAQGGFDKFLKAKDNEKASLLEDITGSKIYGEISTKVFEKYKEKLNNLEILKAQIDNTKILSKEDYEKLTQEIEELKKEYEKLQNNDKEELKQKIETFNNLNENKNKLTIELNNIIEKIKKNPSIQDKKDKLEIASKLKGKIDILKDSLVKLQKQIKDKSNELQNDNKELQNLKQKIKEFNIQKEELYKFIQNKDLSLIDKIEVIKLKYKQLNEKQTELQEIDKFLDEVNIKEQETQKDEIDNKIKIISSEFQMKNKEFDNIKLNDLVKLHSQKQKYEELLKEAKKSQKAKEDKLKKEKQLQNLNNQKKELNSKRDNLEKDIQKLKQIIDSYKTIINFEKERKKLKEGEPCPLCGATHHPYAKQLPEYKDEIEIEFQEKEKELKNLDNKIKQIDLDINTLQVEIEQL